VYERDGIYQLYATLIELDGEGGLFAAFEQLKAKLAAEGLFDAARKKPLPLFPTRIVVVTSSAGAAIRDILRILNSRYPLAEVSILPVRVQGAEAPEEIAEAIDFANLINAGDLIITGRGGGSAEELWAFNDERVAYAIARSNIPVISAVGHEPDVTIADYVADVRASTPSNAAEIAVPDRAELLGRIQDAQARIAAGMKRTVDRQRDRVRRLAAARPLSSPSAYIDDRRLALDNAVNKLAFAMRNAVSVKANRFARLGAALDAMSPLKVLTRGYAIAEKQGSAVRSIAQLEVGDSVNVRLTDGRVECTVISRNGDSG
jgi:exodeoxyribonuclease VII large subunit